MQPGVTLFQGGNGAGKSNLLEAIYMLAVGRSARASSDRELVRRSNGEGEFYTQAAADVVREHDSVNLQINFRSAAASGGLSNSSSAHMSVQKYFRVNGAPRRASTLVGHLNAVMFSADDLGIVYGAPGTRRRYMNILISQIDREYLGAAQRYERVLRQRNHLLRQIREGASRVDELAFWDDELAKEGRIIIARRHATVRRLSEGASSMYRKLSSDGEKLAVEYQPNVALPYDEDVLEEEISDLFQEKLAERRRRELAQGFTVTGPHRDDLGLTLNGMHTAGFASRGQARTAVLALKLAEAAYLRQQRGEEPLILLDDVLSELDIARQAQVLKQASEYHQSLITTAEAGSVAGQLPRGTTRFCVRRGAVKSLG